MTPNSNRIVSLLVQYLVSLLNTDPVVEYLSVVVEYLEYVLCGLVVVEYLESVDSRSL